jgi:hypothetical protein
MMGPRISMFIGLLIGYAESFKYLDRVALGLNSALRLEQKPSIRGFTNIEGKS